MRNILQLKGTKVVWVRKKNLLRKKERKKERKEERKREREKGRKGKKERKEKSNTPTDADDVCCMLYLTSMEFLVSIG